MKQRHISLNATILLFINLFFNGWFLFDKLIFNWQVSLILLPFGFLLFAILFFRGIWLLIKGSPWRRIANHFLPLFIFILIAAIPREYIARFEYMMRSKEFAVDIVSTNMPQGEYKTWQSWSNSATKNDFFIYSESSLPITTESKIISMTCNGKIQKIDTNHYIALDNCSY
ncbi:MAG: hypothetical protein HY254_08645 [Burkholderiales bacterium]|nr:hypothetical protein [Burkholderiales bacterium]